MPRIKRAKARVKREPWKLEKVISGGQVGADIAGVRAAKKAGIPTGGFMPLGYLNHDGLNPAFAREFSMEEAPTGSYRYRTELNARAADGTIRFAYRWHSPGELCTLRVLNEHGKPYIDVHVRDPFPPVRVAQWIRDERIRTLNIAGNADPLLEQFVEEYLSEVFKCLS